MMISLSSMNLYLVKIETTLYFTEGFFLPVEQ